ncbi:hypothetical protein [Crocinitomix algicola]|uniref:hypothetical protein n=1 Tax=Crocinitomix algicola TaxID=1740263 RepID=UPI0008316DB1|nr:hypothetical protein [Crocinitomix algicola]
MKPYLIALSLLICTSIYSNEPVTSIELEKIEKSIKSWTDSSLIAYHGDKFENHRAFYTDDFFIQNTRIELYGEKIEKLKAQKQNGSYPGTENEYNENLKTLEAVILEASSKIQNIDRVAHYEVNYWSNIQTKDGVTVYFEIVFKLNSNFEIISAKENSSIGKIGPQSKIAYKSGKHPIRVIEKD